MTWGERLSIKYKLTIFLLIVTLIPGLTAIVTTYFYTKEKVKDHFIEENVKVISQGKYDIRDYFLSITEIPLSLYANRKFMNVMEQGISNDIDIAQEEVKRSLLNLYFTRKEIEQIYLYVDKGQDAYTVYNTKVSSRGKVENKLLNDYFEKLINERSYFILEPTHDIYSYNNQSDIPRTNVKPVVSFHHALNEVTSGKLLGFISIDIDIAAVKTISDRLYFSEGEQFYLISGNNEVVYSSDSDLIGTFIDDRPWLQQIRQQNEMSFEWKDDSFGGVFVYDQLPAPFEKWMIVKGISNERMYSGAQSIARMNIYILLFFFLLSAFATLLVAIKLISPIKILIENMKKVEKGRLEVDFQSLGKDEFGQLGYHFKSMVNQINELIVRKYRLEIENKSNQIRVLQSQINPHFLYNSLQSIGTIALRNKVPEIYTLITSLSSIMRYSMNIDEDVVPLTKEVNHVNAYLSLQKQRFQERLFYSITVDDELKKIMVPKMILQPVVENYFKHGFEMSNLTGKIDIQILKEKERLTILIEDNGLGVTEERLKEIELMLTKGIKLAKAETTSIGLQNVYERLELYYGEKGLMKVGNREGGGFKVTLAIPLYRIGVEEDESNNR
ncbi:sensor histidine kinase [Anaerobacillus alkaliphilus]|uniref:histidine kinase n=1 Tax=Anaerobacillus alkaliphilus TaxID=1548597 RepID=A0A4Q0VSB7_9BACI|nr:sensor histidine kinase [Anaerobacillus alkaliphilus]